MEQSLTRTAAKERALDSARRFIAFHEERFWRGARDLRLSGRDDALLNRIINDPRISGFLPLANGSVRLSAQAAMIEELHVLFARAAPELKLVTMTWDSGFTYEDKPQVDLQTMKRKAAEALAAVGLNAVCAIEVDGLSRVVDDERARRLIFHVHGACWTAGGPFRPRSIQEELCRAFEHPWGVLPVRFTAKNPLDWKAIAGLGMYLLKAPRCLKKRAWRSGLGRHKLLRAPAVEFRPSAAVRLMEVHSKCDVRDVVFGVGQGRRVVRRWRDTVSHEYPARSRHASIDDGTIERLWQRAFSRAETGPCAAFEPAALGLRRQAEA